MHVTIYPARNWCGPDDRARLEPWGFRFGPTNAYGNGPILQETVVLTLTSLAQWEALLRACGTTMVVVGTEDAYGEQAFTVALEAQPSSPADEAQHGGE